MSMNEGTVGTGAASSGAAAASSGAAAASSGAAAPGSGAAADDAAAADVAAARPKKRKNLTTAERTAALHDLLARTVNGVLRRGAAGEVGEKYGNSRRAMSNLWKKYQAQKAAGEAVPDLSCRRRGSARDLTQHKEALRLIPLEQRTTERSAAASIGLPKTTFRRRMKDLGVESHTRSS
ncbi:unnamed protein product [Pylaiella littoralis]